MIINSQPIWSFTAKKQLQLWYGHVSLLKDYVIGQWFVLKRNSGECLWEKEFSRPNAVFEIVDDVILATETRSDGPWTADFGCYGIALTNGELLWQWYGNGIRGAIAKSLDKIPVLTNELRPHFHGVCGNECATKQGDILEIHTGKFLRHESELSIPAKTFGAQTDAQKIYNGQAIEVSKGLLLSTREVRVKQEKQPNGVTMMTFPKATRPFGFILRNAQDQIVWDWSPEESNLFPVTNFYGWRLLDDKLILLCSEERATIPIRPEKPLVVKPNAAKYQLLVVDVFTGKVAQQFVVTQEKVISCRIEDMGSNGLLISHDNLHLRYYSIN
jgi:hypothetical protein